MSAIEIKALTKNYGDRCAVDHISLEIKEGELFSLLGVNGAGKTTTIRMLCGLTKPSDGNALVYGKSILTQLPEVKQLGNVSPQETSVAGNLNVRENLIMMAEIYGQSKAEANKRVDELIQQFSLDEVAGQRAKTLSGGWQRRLSIAMALVSNPSVLYLDEPTLGLDVLARRELWRIIRSLKGKITIVLTTHYMEESEELSDRIAIMVRGKIRALGTAKELLELTGTDSLENAFIAIAEGEETKAEPSEGGTL